MKLPTLTSTQFSRQPDQTTNLINKLIRKVNELEDTVAKLSKTQSVGGNNYKLPIASETRLGGIRVGDNLSISNTGILSAITTETSSYNSLNDKPQINEVELVANKNLPDLNVNRLTNIEIDELINNT